MQSKTQIVCGSEIFHSKENIHADEHMRKFAHSIWSTLHDRYRSLSALCPDYNSCYVCCVAFISSSIVVFNFLSFSTRNFFFSFYPGLTSHRLRIAPG